MAAPTLTLKQFMLRQEVLKLYRTFFRTIRKLPDERQRGEIADWVRADFKANKDIDPNDEEEPVYNVVANPDLRFTGNFFHTYTEELLEFPGANAVPLGSLDISGNKVSYFLFGFIFFRIFVPIILPLFSWPRGKAIMCTV